MPTVPADFSVAPEIAQLAARYVPSQDGPAPATAGRLAAALTRLAAAPQRWWDLVRFDAGGPVRIPVDDAAGAWLLVVPPGAAAPCDCAYATLIAGEAAENGRPLRPGRVLLHAAGPHQVTGAAHGYSVSLHSL
ncbi:MAG TPA: cysteine dioxygenase [Trebonia sp.]|nr:cysteine dioxygenase [Trebonia sp.]